ncbi:MAG: class I SAM-dependent methyltransferase [Jannaschia sp.]
MNFGGTPDNLRRCRHESPDGARPRWNTREKASSNAIRSDLTRPKVPSHRSRLRRTATGKWADMQTTSERKMTADRAAPYLNPRRRPFRSSSARLFFAKRTLKQIRDFLRKLKRGEEFRRHTSISFDDYETYDDWEIRIDEEGSNFTLYHGAMAQTSFREIRDHYLEPVKEQIERLLDAGGPRPRVLEVGAGNCTNLVRLKETFGDRIELSGVDLSPERLRVGKTYWGERLEAVDLSVDSALTLSTIKDAEFDLVYSMHCLEQLPYHADQAVSSMSRASRDTVVFVEPVIEFANTAQKLYTLFGDQLRTLLPILGKSDLEIVSSVPAKMLANPLNMTGMVICRKKKPDGSLGDD